MRRFNDEMLCAVDVRAFCFGVVAPQDKNEILALFGEFANDRIGELLPPLPLMRTRFARAHRQSRIEKKNSLLGPMFEITLLRQGFEGQRTIC